MLLSANSACGALSLLKASILSNLVEAVGRCAVLVLGTRSQDRSRQNTGSTNGEGTAGVQNKDKEGAKSLALTT